MNILAIALVSLIWSGCQGLDLIPAVSPSGGGPEESKRFLVDALNFWLGKPKDERIRVFGAPSRCARLDGAQEQCEWKKTNQQVVFLYDSNGIARSWSYRGDFGGFTSGNYQRGAAQPVASKPSPQEMEWVHPTKAASELTDETMQCRSAILSDPNSINTARGPMTGGESLSGQQLDQCLKQRGWVRKEKP